MKQVICCLGVILALVTLCGCQSAPNQGAITSKKNGAFDAAVFGNTLNIETKEPTEAVTMEPERETVRPLETAPMEQLIEAKEQPMINIVANDRFFSTDESVSFNFCIEKSVPQELMPVVMVSPHALTSQDAERVARALFPDSVFYEADPLMAPQYTKSDLQEVIQRMLPISGNNEAIRNTIEKYTIMMEDAPEENPHEVCDWAYKKGTYYVESKDVADKMDTSNDNDEVQAITKVNGIPYLLCFSTRDKTDFKINNISVRIRDNLSASGVDIPYFRARLCRTEKPGKEVLTMIKDKANTILQEISLGEWEIDTCRCEETESEGKMEYSIYVTATPKLEGISTIRRPQFKNLKSKETYASNYYLSDVNFEFSTDGTLISFSMMSPIDVTHVVNENVKMLDFAELEELARNYFSLTDINQYCKGLARLSTEKAHCTVTISDINYGLTRVKVPDTDNSYYYIPAVSFIGEEELTGVESGNTFYVSEKPEVILLLNAVDGSVINLVN